LRIKLHRLLALSAVILMTGCTTAPRQESTVGDYLSARLAARTNDVGAAAQAFAAAQAEAPGAPQILRDAFFFQLAAGNIDAAKPLAARLAALEDAGDDGLAAMVLAAHAIKHKDYVKARAAFLDEDVAGYMVPTVNIVRAWLAAPSGGAEAALASLRENAGGEFKGFYPLQQAFLSEQAGQLDQARAAYQLAVMSFGGPVEVAVYGGFLERADDQAAAREFYELMAETPGLARIPARAGLARLDAGAAPPPIAATSPAQGVAVAFYALANGILQQTVSQRAAAQEAGFKVGDANYNMPLAFAQLALYLDPAFDGARRLSGSILNVYGESEKAIAMLSQISPSSPYYQQTRIEIAGALNTLDRGDEAISMLRKAARREKNSYDVRLALSGLVAAKGEHRDAVKILDAVIASLDAEPQSDAWRLYLSRAVSLMAIDDWPRAEADLKRAVALAPEEAIALNYLGYSWAERGENLDEAFDLIEKAVVLDPNSGAIIDSLGWAYYQRGHYEVAVGHLEQAASLEPGDPTVTDHLGDVYWRLGRKIEAGYQWRRVLELEPDDALRASVEKKLEFGLDGGGE
jgi:tetratricopeptide (TPR) repeat protein/outer membrane murein-binding lipoprotein Lpp